MHKDIQILVDKAIDQNIIVFDNLAKVGNYSVRLELLAMDFMRREYKEDIAFIVKDPLSHIENYFKSVPDVTLPEGKSSLVLYVSDSRVVFGAY